MSNKIFALVIGVLLLAGFGFVVTRPTKVVPRPGIEQSDHGQEHVKQDAKKYGESDPPTSGDHAEPVKWGVYDKEVPDINSIHNLEHGGIYISYQPDLPVDQIKQINSLFGAPFSRAGFSPTKALVAPRKENGTPIILTSWRRELKLDKFDEQTMVDYYLKNIGKSPEPNAS